MPIIIAHRGASKIAPENTMAAFRKAVEEGAGGIELDIHICKTGQMVVIHDETVDRTSNGTGFIKDKTLEELKELNFGSWFDEIYKNEKIPVLDEVLDFLTHWDGLLNIEVKNGPVFYPGIEEKLCMVLKKRSLEKKVIISSFNHYSLVETKKIFPRVRTGVLYMAGLYNPWDYAKRLGAEAVHPYFYSLTPEVIMQTRQNNIQINSFTVDGPEYIKNLALAGVDGIITNVPGQALQIIKQIKL